MAMPLRDFIRLLQNPRVRADKDRPSLSARLLKSLSLNLEYGPWPNGLTDPPWLNRISAPVIADRGVRKRDSNAALLASSDRRADLAGISRLLGGTRAPA